jgi:hypothetical protein
MVRFNAVVKRFAAQAEKTGWTYIVIPAEVADKIKPGTKKGYRVKGKIDNHKIEKLSILPMGDGSFILTLNKPMRKALGKGLGATVQVAIEEDPRELEIFPELISCLKDEPLAYNRFNKLTPSHQRYFSKWITDAKTDHTRIKRIAKTVTAMLNNQSFGEALKSEE